MHINNFLIFLLKVSFGECINYWWNPNLWASPIVWIIFQYLCGMEKITLKLLNNCSFWTRSVQFSSAAQSCLTLYNPINCSTLGHPIHHQLLEFSQTRVHRVDDTIQPSHPLSSPSPPAPNPWQHQSLFQWVNSSHEVAKVLAFQL